MGDDADHWLGQTLQQRGVGGKDKQKDKEGGEGEKVSLYGGFTQTLV